MENKQEIIKLLDRVSKFTTITAYECESVVDLLGLLEQSKCQQGDQLIHFILEWLNYRGQIKLLKQQMQDFRYKWTRKGTGSSKYSWFDKKDLFKKCIPEYEQMENLLKSKELALTQIRASIIELTEKLKG